MLSHKSSSYSYSIQFLLNSAYFQFLFCKLYFPLPFHQAQWDVCSAPLHTLPAYVTDSYIPKENSSLPTCNPYVWTLGQGHNCKRTQSWTSSMNVSLRIPKGCLQGMETSKEQPWPDCAVLPGVSAGYWGPFLLPAPSSRSLQPWWH